MSDRLQRQNIQALNRDQITINNALVSTPKYQNINNTFKTEASSNGSLIFYRTDGRQSLYFQSKWSPQEEAKAFVRSSYRPNCQVVILLGIEFGYIARELLSVMRQDQRMILIEPDSEIFSYAIQKVDLTSIFLDERVWLHVYSGERDFRSFVEKCFSRLDVDLSRNNISTLISPPYLQLCDDRIKRIVQISNLCIRHIRTVQNTITFFADIWLENYIQNMSYFDKSLDAESFFDQYQGLPAYLIAAGPSLDKNIQELKSVKRDGVIFAGYTSLNILLANGIRPDFVVAIDGRQLGYESCEQQKECFDVPLIYSPLADYRLLRKHKGVKIRAVVAYDEYSKYVYQITGKPYHALFAAGTVMATMLDLAYLFGCSPIAFVGQDLAFGENQAYASGSNYDNLPGYGKQLMEGDNVVMIQDIYGGERRTSPVFLEYKRGLEEYIALKQEEGRFLDATEGGALIEGTVVCTLKQVVEYGKKRGRGNITEREDKLLKDAGYDFNEDSGMDAERKLAINQQERRRFSEKIQSIIKYAFQGLDEIADLLEETLKEIQILPQRRRDGLGEKEYENILIQKMESCNRCLNEWNEDTELFRFSIMGRLYESDRKASLWREKNGDLIEAERVWAVCFYSSVLGMIREKKDMFVAKEDWVTV